MQLTITTLIKAMNIYRLNKVVNQFQFLESLLKNYKYKKLQCFKQVKDYKDYIMLSWLDYKIKKDYL